jgi:hypothetical protein
MHTSVQIGSLEAAFPFALTLLQSAITCSAILRPWRENPSFALDFSSGKRRGLQ